MRTIRRTLTFVIAYPDKGTPSLAAKWVEKQVWRQRQPAGTSSPAVKQLHDSARPEASVVKWLVGIGVLVVTAILAVVFS